jgi:hypothetical protein
MLKNLNLRATLLFVHGALALNLGLILFYLHAIMTNPLFEAVAIASAVVFAGTALLLAAVADWLAAALGQRACTAEHEGGRNRAFFPSTCRHVVTHAPQKRAQRRGVDVQPFGRYAAIRR